MDSLAKHKPRESIWLPSVKHRFTNTIYMQTAEYLSNVVELDIADIHVSEMMILKIRNLFYTNKKEKWRDSGAVNKTTDK
jgi:hypothetical protein